MGRLIYSGPSRSGTTVGATFLNMHPDVCMTNEVGIYRLAKYSDYLTRLYNKIVNNPNFGFNLPDYFDVSNIKALNSDSIKQAILDVEKLIFDDNYKFFGDKGIFSDEADVLRDNGLSFDLIVIYRDPRDVVSSVIRHKGSNYGYDSGDNPAIILANWKDHLTDMLLTSRIVADRSLVIKFEDFIENPGKNSEKIEDFLGLTGFADLERQAFSKEASNVSYYTKFFPNWKDYFNEELSEFTDVLGYNV